MGNVSFKIPIHSVLCLSMLGSPSRSFYFCMHYLRELYSHQIFAKFTYIMLMLQTFEVREKTLCTFWF